MGREKAGVVQAARAPAGLQSGGGPFRTAATPEWPLGGGGYFLAIDIAAAATKRRFTSSQLMFRMNASRYALRSEP